ncbi:hypothetical protein ES703_79980 [subsurface metagenome]
MNQFIFDSFTEAIVIVFSENRLGRITINDSRDSDQMQEVITHIGISGAIRGNLILKTDFKSAARLVGTILEEMELQAADQDSFGELHRTAMGEIANQISGRAITILSTHKIDCHITPPTIITGRKITYQLSDSDSSVYKKIQGRFGAIWFALGIKNS